jgi:alpha-amylase/alpha-mannosidase (GH57 family)
VASHLNVAFLWHFHQPDYVHPEDGIAVLPWVRMHGVRGYTDMVAILEEQAAARVTLNFTPILLRQLEEVVANWGGAREDRLLRLVRALPCPLAAADRAYLVGMLLSAHRQNMIAPLPRFLELCERCEPALKSGGPLPLSDADLLDLAVLFHVAWSGFRVKRRPEILELARKGRDFTPADRDLLLRVHQEELAGLVARVKALADGGRVELSTTPEHHPILPLLCGFDSTEFPQAGGSVEPFRFAQPDDAADQVARGVAMFQRRFERAPRGMWPAEGAISEPAARQFLAGAAAAATPARLDWIASDEAILFSSRAGDPALKREDLYRPHTFATPDGELALFFRDHELSDRIGFVYQTWPAEAAVRDFLRRLDEVRAACPFEEAVVAVILDGENPWEQYPGAGEPFLRALYQELTAHPRLRMTTMGEALQRAREDVTKRGESLPRLPRLARGSWIDGNLDTWAGQREKLEGWRLLAQARSLFAGRRLDQLPSDVAASLRALEGSDWYWWFGDDHFTAQRDLFEELFHAHLRRVFKAAGRDAPPLPDPDARREDVKPLREPLEEIRPEGRVEDLFQWQSAGWFDLTAAGGAMTRARRVARRLLFGFEGGCLHLGVECEGRLAKGRVFFFAPRPRGFDGVIDSPERKLPWLRFEVALAELGATAGSALRFRVELETADGEVLHWPGGRLARVRVPTEEFTSARWYV